MLSKFNTVAFSNWRADPSADCSLRRLILPIEVVKNCQQLNWVRVAELWSNSSSSLNFCGAIDIWASPLADFFEPYSGNARISAIYLLNFSSQSREQKCADTQGLRWCPTVNTLQQSVTSLNCSKKMMKIRFLLLVETSNGIKLLTQQNISFLEELFQWPCLSPDLIRSKSIACSVVPSFLSDIFDKTK